MKPQDIFNTVRVCLLLFLIALIAVLCITDQNAATYYPPIIELEPVVAPNATEDKQTPAPQKVPAEAPQEPVVPEIHGEEPQEPVAQELKPTGPALPEPKQATPKEEAPQDPPQEETYVRYSLTDEERAVVEAVVAAESGGEDFDGQCLVAQCILNTAEALGIRPDEVVLAANQYATPNYELRYLVKDAVSAVFDKGYTVTDEPIRYFYAPRWCESPWHESLTFVIEHGGHRFFK